MGIGYLFGKEVAGNITFVGLSNAGKTTLLHRIQGQENKITPTEIPTMGMNAERLTVGETTFLAIDCGGQIGFAQAVWEPYVRNAIGVIFVFDAADPEVIETNGEWFSKVVNWLGPETIFMFLANKCDLEDSLDLKAVIDKLGLKEIISQRPRSFGVYRASALTGEGFKEAWDWFSGKVLKRILEKAEE